MLNARIKLRHLQAFLEVARQRSFARAADRLAITLPGMSKTVRELENLGCQLEGAALLTYIAQRAESAESV